MAFDDYTNMSDREILISLAEKNINLNDKMENIQEGVCELTNAHDELDARLACAERITQPLNNMREAANTWITRLFIALLFVFTAIVLAAGEETREIMRRIVNLFHRIPK